MSGMHLTSVMSNQVKTHNGKPCKRCELTLRYLSDNRCVNCHIKRQRFYYEKNRIRILKQKEDYCLQEKEYRRVWSKNYRVAHREQNRQHSCKRRARVRKAFVIEWSEHQWNQLLEWFANCCAYCGCKGNLTIDHFIPLVKGGDHALYNIVPACLKCNTSKKHSDPYVWAKSKNIPIDQIDWIKEILEGFKP